MKSSRYDYEQCAEFVYCFHLTRSRIRGVRRLMICELKITNSQSHRTSMSMLHIIINKQVNKVETSGYLATDNI